MKTNAEDPRHYLNPFLPAVIHGISLFTAVKNRAETLEEALATWVKHDEIDEIIIVDWGSDESLTPLVSKYQNGKIFLAVVENQQKWILSLAYNLAARLTTRSMLLKMDADVKIYDRFFEAHPLTPGMFYTGNWALGRDENETHLNGVAFLYRDDFFSVNGYNEYIKTYGWEDSDLYLRLEDKKLKRFDFDLDTLHHIEHGNRTRFQDKPGYFRNISGAERENLNIIINRHLGYNTRPWSPAHRMVRFSVEKGENNVMLCRQISEDRNVFPEEVIHQSEVAAVKERVKSLEPGIPEPLYDVVERAELIEFYNLFFANAGNQADPHILSFIRKIMHYYTTVVLNNDREIQRLNADIASVKADIDRLNVEVARSEQEIRQKEQVIRDRDLTIQDRDVTIRNKDLVHADLEDRLHEKDSLISDRDKSIEQLARQVSDRDEHIRQVNQSVAELEQLNIRQAEIIRDFEHLLAEQRQAAQQAAEQAADVSRQRDQEILEKIAIIIARDRVLGEKEEKIVKMSGDYSELLAFLRQVEKESELKSEAIKALRDSYSWKFGHFTLSAVAFIASGFGLFKRSKP
jgi:hypothetical protein